MNGVGSGYRITMTDNDLERELPPTGGINSRGSLIIGQGLPGSAHISINDSASQFHVTNTGAKDPPYVNTLSGGTANKASKETIVTPHLGGGNGTMQSDRFNESSLMVKPSRSELFSEDAARQDLDTQTNCSLDKVEGVGTFSKPMLINDGASSNFFSMTKLE